MGSMSTPADIHHTSRPGSTVSSSFTSPSGSLSMSSSGNPKRSTRKRRDFSRADMPQGAPWDLTDQPGKWTRDMTDTPILDIDTWVRRLVEERRKETEQKGRVPRPMNCFMLYRWANTESIKRLSQRHNPRDISSIAGKRWREEPQSVRDKFQQLAEIEHDGHAEAHPGYKFKRKARKRQSIANSVAHLGTSELSEHNSCDWSSAQGFEIGIQSPNNYPCSGTHPEDIPETLVAPIEGVFQGGCFKDLIMFPGEPHYDLLCPQPIYLLTNTVIHGSYVDLDGKEACGIYRSCGSVVIISLLWPGHCDALAKTGQHLFF